ncbi:MAG TPA: hypothetical protein VH165_29720 [Kofleriaceae bacterium]|nr:hypothetical protein [Kofleriaceae bacterium]
MTPGLPASFLAPSASGPASEVRAAFATLERAQQRLLDAVVFEGQSCARIAQSIGAAAPEVRQRVGEAMLALRARMPGAAASSGSAGAAGSGVVDGDRGGAVAAMLVLRALGALDPDETELVDMMLLHQPALQRAYDDDCALVAELCLAMPRVAPAPSVLARLGGSIDDDLDAN